MTKEFQTDQIKPKRRKFYVAKLKIMVVKETTDTERPKVNSSADVASLKLVKDELANCDREKFICLHLSTKNAIVSYEVISVGTLNSSLVHPREVFKAAILSNSAAVILVHNHPSGVAEPSENDLSLTRRLVKAGNLLGIDVLDHVILGDGCFVSIKERGLM